MKKLIFISVVILLAACGPQKVSQAELSNAKPVVLYETTRDFNTKNAMKVNAVAVFTNESPQHVTIKKFIDIETGTKMKFKYPIWAITYNGNNYFHLAHSSDVFHNNSFAKFDIEGRICAIVIDENSPPVLKSTSNYYGGGLTGVLIGESNKWGKNWLDKDGTKKKILFIDTWDQPIFNNKELESRGNYLTGKQLKDIISKNNINIDYSRIKDIKFEKVLEIIETINSK